MLKRLLLILLIPMLTQCGSKEKQPQKIIMKHPETYDFQNCEGGKWNNEESFKAIEECIQKYKREGYKVWGQR